jgi:hypothetical protein
VGTLFLCQVFVSANVFCGESRGGWNIQIAGKIIFTAKTAFMTTHRIGLAQGSVCILEFNAIKRGMA